MIETVHLQLLLATFAGWVRRQQSHVIAYLIEENRVLKEQLESGGRRLRFTDDQRRRLAAKRYSFPFSARSGGPVVQDK
jgi:hypothetical protein